MFSCYFLSSITPSASKSLGYLERAREILVGLRDKKLFFPSQAGWLERIESEIENHKQTAASQPAE